MTDTDQAPAQLRVIIESPYAGPPDADHEIRKAAIDANIRYAEACLLDSLQRGESPYASHLLYTRVLNDDNPEDRTLGMEASTAWLIASDLVAVYTDRGISNGMKWGIEKASQYNIRVEFRELGHAAQFKESNQ